MLGFSFLCVNFGYFLWTIKFLKRSSLAYKWQYKYTKTWFSLSGNDENKIDMRNGYYFKYRTRENNSKIRFLDFFRLFFKNISSITRFCEISSENSRDLFPLIDSTEYQFSYDTKFKALWNLVRFLHKEEPFILVLGLKSSKTAKR